VLVSVAAVAVLAIDALYVAIIRAQGGPPSDEPLVAPFVAGYLALLAAGLGATLVVPGLLRVGVRGAAAGGLLLMAVLTGFSIGAGVLVGALVAIAALALTVSRHPSARTVLAAVAGIIVGVALLLVGLQLAWSHVVCSPSGQSGGTIPSLVGVGESYQCSDGVLTVER
jgi:hypothetical protein